MLGRAARPPRYPRGLFGYVAFALEGLHHRVSAQDSMEGPCRTDAASWAAQEFSIFELSHKVVPASSVCLLVYDL